MGRAVVARRNVLLPNMDQGLSPFQKARRSKVALGSHEMTGIGSRTYPTIILQRTAIGGLRSVADTLLVLPKVKYHQME